MLSTLEFFLFTPAKFAVHIRGFSGNTSVFAYFKGKSPVQSRNNPHIIIGMDG